MTTPHATPESSLTPAVPYTNHIMEPSSNSHRAETLELVSCSAQSARHIVCFLETAAYQLLGFAATDPRT